MKEATSKRLRGLDTLRALAIGAVMLFHLGGYLPAKWYPATRYGWIGVDLFFVLSGYLIGGQLCLRVRDGKPLALGEFYRKRAFRILPAYIVVLALYFTWPRWRDGNGLSPLWQFLSFTMNLLIDYPKKNSFSHVWSLCVEEQFYLLLPLIVMVLAWKPSWKKTVLVLAGVLCWGIAIRAWLVLHVLAPVAPLHSERSAPFIISYMEHIYYPTYSRLDGLLAGVSVALLELFRPQAWQRLGHYRNQLFLGGIGVTTVALYTFHDRFISNAGVTAFSSVFGYPMLAFGLALLLMSAAMQGSWLSNTRIYGTRTVALMAYSLYLSHKSVADVIHSLYPQFIDTHPGEGTIIIFAAAFAAASLLYLTVERPFLSLRDRPGRSASAEALLDPAL